MAEGLLMGMGRWFDGTLILDPPREMIDYGRPGLKI